MLLLLLLYLKLLKDFLVGHLVDVELSSGLTCALLWTNMQTHLGVSLRFVCLYTCLSFNLALSPCCCCCCCLLYWTAHALNVDGKNVTVRKVSTSIVRSVISPYILFIFSPNDK